ncbi:hypothetical protein ASE04_17710 [Rhizobium sp. Root708]|uniref:hypothetical protein n=1 Tax=Rhizobium sp. Root708 TaxID=1736592 RepID=UPI0006F62FE6|nr:hypothetical protein [Rhizobium sp. Root708]KRB50379.1 hypothetical protein ASE04_17710 [Rhizobium sp. Root708]
MTLRNALFCTLLLTAPLSAEAGEEPGALLPASVIFATSTGYWEDDGELPIVQHSAASAKPDESKKAQSKARHGYYKIFAVRQPDRTAKVFLQQIAQTEDGPDVLSTVEIQELNDLKPYVTDIRPENSTGMLKEPGLFATVFLKTDPDAEADSWTVIIDEFGEVTVGKASN